MDLQLGAQSHVAVSFEVRSTPLIAMLLALCGSGMRIWDSHRKPAFTRRAPASSTAWCRRSRRRRHTFYPRSPTASQALPTGSDYRESGMYAAMVCCSAMRARGGVTFVAADHTRPGAGRCWARGMHLHGQYRLFARLGPCSRLRRNAVADAAAGTLEDFVIATGHPESVRRASSSQRSSGWGAMCWEVKILLKWAVVATLEPWLYASISVARPAEVDTLQSAKRARRWAGRRRQRSRN